MPAPFFFLQFLPFQQDYANFLAFFLFSSLHPYKPVIK